MADYKDPTDFWKSPEGKKILAEEREKTFGGDKSAVTMEMIERIFKRYREVIESTEWTKR